MLRSPFLWLVVSAFAVGTGVVLAAARGGGTAPAAAPTSTGAGTTPALVTKTQPGGVVAGCSLRSMADVGPAYEDSANIVIGPFAFVSGEPTPASTIREVGGQKYLVLVRPGHVITLNVPPAARSFAGLGFGPLPQGEITLREAHDTVTFRPCRRGQSSGATANGPVTMWVGFVITPAPACVPVDVYIDKAPAPRRFQLEHGTRCPSS